MLTLQDIKQIQHDADKLTRRRFEDAAEEGSFVPTPTPGVDGDADESQSAEANDADHVLGDAGQVEQTGKEQNEQAESVDGKPKRGRPAKEDQESK